MIGTSSSVVTRHYLRSAALGGVLLIVAILARHVVTVGVGRGRPRYTQNLTRHLTSTVRVMESQDDFLWRQICRFEDVCLGRHQMSIFTKSDASARVLTNHLQDCCVTGDSQYSPLPEADLKLECAGFSGNMCYCFTGQMPPLFMPRPVGLPAFRPEDSFLLNQWTPAHLDIFHNPAHFAFKALSFMEVSLYRQQLRLPQFKTIIWHDASAPFTNFEETIMNLTNLVLDATPRIITKNDLIQPHCFKSIYSSLKYHQFWGVHLEPYQLLRRVINSTFQVPLGLESGSCPPFKAGIFRRKDGNGLRKILNEDSVAQVLRDAGFVDVEFFSTHAGQSAEEQARLFNSFGFVVSTHGSQLTNMLYMRQNAAVLELQPVVIDQVWSELAQLISIYHVHSVGHLPTPMTDPIRDMLRECAPYNRARRSCPVKDAAGLQAQDIQVDLAQLKSEVDAIWHHLQVTCRGRFSPHRLY